MAQEPPLPTFKQIDSGIGLIVPSYFCPDGGHPLLGTECTYRVYPGHAAVDIPNCHNFRSKADLAAELRNVQFQYKIRTPPVTAKISAAQWEFLNKYCADLEKP
jgi:hypothetical protein